MCGLVGIFHKHAGQRVDQELLRAMNAVQHHRGPDEGGEHIEPGVGLAHRRLSIIDLSSGQQPLFNEDQSVVVVYNGEIYNFRELSKELQAAGHSFRTHCDTEVIVHAWEQWGPSCVERFRGMFAFALWDRNQQTLFLARDRIGIKPLYYTILPDDTVLFSSEMKSILQCRDVNREQDAYAIEEYFTFGYVPDPRTILKSVHKLSPGHTLTLQRGKTYPGPRQYWDVPFAPHEGITEQQAEEELMARLREAVDIRLVSEVPLGAFLSGGVDSSAIVAMMAGLSDDPVNTCSISFGDPKFNESQFAAQVAGYFKTNHYVEQVDPDDFDLIDTLAQTYDEPYADSSAMPTYRVCELARKQVTVVLSGDGGDENLAGYRRYRWHMYEQKVRNILPQFIRGPLFGLAGAVYPKADWAPQIFRAKTTLQAVARSPLEGFLHSVSVIPNHLRARLFSHDLKQQLHGYSAMEVFRKHALTAPQNDDIALVQYLDMKTYLPGDILTKVDRASMAHSLEVRVPILDHPLVEWMSGLPSTMKLHGREGKYVFKKSLEHCLPHNILYRPKMGFAVPLSSWFRGPLKERMREAVLGTTLADTGYFDSKFLKKLVDEHQSGFGEHSAALWTILMFEAFQRKVMPN